MDTSIFEWNTNTQSALSSYLSIYLGKKLMVGMSTSVSLFAKAFISDDGIKLIFDGGF